MKKHIISLSILFSASLAGAHPLSIEELAAQIKADEAAVRNNPEADTPIIRRAPTQNRAPEKPQPEYGNLQSEAIAFSKRVPAYLYQHPKDSLADLVANEASKHDYNEAQTERFLENRN